MHNESSAFECVEFIYDEQTRMGFDDESMRSNPITPVVSSLPPNILSNDSNSFFSTATGFAPIVPKNDRRLHKYLRLENEMEVMLIEERARAKGEQIRAACCLGIGAGCFSDDPRFPGIAHLTEHVITTGSTKYPKDSSSDWEAWLAQHGGEANACTGHEATQFYFTCSPCHLPEALDRFSSYFKSPTFPEELLSREVNAVDEEYRESIQDDEVRVREILGSTCRPGHPLTKFGWGNTKSLNTQHPGLLRQAVIDFWKQYYKSESAKLAVISEDIGELEQLVRGYFTLPRAQQGWKRPDFSTWHWPFEACAGKVFMIGTVQDIYKLTVSWWICGIDEYRSKVEGLLLELIGSEEKGSLLDVLRNEKLALELEAGVDDDERLSCGYLFEVSITLTEHGCDNYTEVISILFQYIALLRKLSPTQRHRLFDKYQKLAQIEFDNKVREEGVEYVTWITTQMLMNKFRPAHILCGGELYWEYSDEKFISLINELSPRCARFDLLSQKFSATAQQEEPWFGGKYSVNEIWDSTLQKWEKSEKIHPELATPSQNDWISTDFKMLKTPKMDSPKMIMERPDAQVFWKIDVTFNCPRVQVFVLLSTGLVREHHRYWLSLNLYVKLFQDAVKAWMYPMKQSGLEATVSVERRGLAFHFWGYGQHIERFIRKVLKWFSTFEIKEERFAIIKNKYHRKLIENFMEPSFQALHLKRQLMMSYAVSDEALRYYSGEIELKHVQECRERVFIDGFLECLIQGNIDEEQAVNLAEVIIEGLGLTTQIDVLQMAERHVMLPHGIETRIMQRTTSPQEKQNCILFAHQIGPSRIQTQMLTMLLTKLLEDQFFDQLRTKEQLGYTCWTWYENHLGLLYLFFEIVSSKSPSIVRERIREFIAQTFPVWLGAIDDETVKRYIHSVLDDILESPSSLADEVKRMWHEVTSHSWLWDRPKLQADAVKEIKKADLLRFYHETVSPISGFEGKLPRRLVVEIWGQGADIPKVKTVEHSRVLQKAHCESLSDVQYISADRNQIECFKRRLPLWPDFESR